MSLYRYPVLIKKLTNALNQALYDNRLYPPRNIRGYNIHAGCTSVYIWFHSERIFEDLSNVSLFCPLLGPRKGKSLNFSISECPSHKNRICPTTFGLIWLTGPWKTPFTKSSWTTNDKRRMLPIPCWLLIRWTKT